MKRLSLKEVKELLKEDHNYCIRINEITRQIHLVRFNFGCSDDIIGYITFNQLIKLNMTIGLIELPISEFMIDYYRIKKEY